MRKTQQNKQTNKHGNSFNKKRLCFSYSFLFKKKPLAFALNMLKYNYKCEHENVSTNIKIYISVLSYIIL